MKVSCVDKEGAGVARGLRAWDEMEEAEEGKAQSKEGGEQERLEVTS